jgi:acetate kinase
MKVLVINAGSSSIKYQLFEMENETVLAKGKVERIGMETAILSHESYDQKEFRDVSEILDHTTAIKKVLAILVDKKVGVLEKIEEVDAVGHRIVHGGEKFSQSVLITEEVKRSIRQLFDLAPLHNPPNMMGIQAAEDNLPGVPEIAVFDTAFHQSMPPESFMYAIPSILYRKHKVRRYGFHGTSHEYVCKQAAELSGKPLEQLKIISCHIGNGASCTAVLKGKSYDTSMGMTPLEGLIMGTRSGDLDPAIVPFTMAKEDLTLGEVKSMLNKHSGLIGISGISSDMREIEEAMEQGDQRAKLAFDMYEYRIRKYIGSYSAAMNGLDVLIFTAGVGENSPLLRETICRNLTFFGVEIDGEANESKSDQARKISGDDSKVDVFVIPTNEELMIARDTKKIVANSG